MRTLLRLALRVFPRDFRREFGPEMLDVVRSDYDRHRARGRTRSVLFAVAAIVDLILSGLRERIRPSWRQPGAGMPTPDAWRRPAGPGRRVSGLATDLRFAFRTLRRSGSTAALATLTLGLGIATTTVIFGAVEGVLINPVRLEDADRYVAIYRAGVRDNNVLLSPTHELADLWLDAESFELFELHRWTRPTVTGIGPARTVAGMKISARFPRLLGMPPILGRTFAEEELEPGGPDVVMLGHAFWRSRFGGREDVIGRTITLDGRPHEIVGVLPAGLTPPASVIQEVAVWLPYRGPESFGGPAITAKLKPGVTRERAEAELASLMAGHELADRFEPRLVDAETLLGDAVRNGLKLLMAAASVLLLIATLNVAGLFLGRTYARTRETAVRAALGAGRSRIARQSLVEGGLIGAAAGGLGIPLAYVGLNALKAMRPGDLDALNGVAVNPTVLAFAAGIAIAASTVFSLAPAIQAAATSGAVALRSGRRLTTGGTAAERIRLGLVVGEIALSVVLLVGAGLLVRTVANLYRLDPGFRAEEVVRLDIELPRWKYETGDTRIALKTALRERLDALPGVADVATAAGAPPRSGIHFGTFEIEGRPRRGSREPTVFYGNSAGPSYFRVLGQALLAGRGFTKDEARTNADVYVVGRTTAARYWGDRSPVGARVRLGGDASWHTVVGVAEDVAITGPRGSQSLQLYSPAPPATVTTWLLRAEGAPNAVAAAALDAVHALDADLVAEATPVARDLRESVARQRFIMVVLMAFASVAVVLAAVGVYGVLSQLVTQRRREIGIRISLGAEPRRVLGLVLKRGLGGSALGLLLGLPAAFAASGIVSSQLYGVGRGDAVTYALASILLLATALLASWIPARKATRVDPMETVREE